MNQTNSRQSLAELGENCSYNEDIEVLEYDEHLIFSGRLEDFG